MTEYVCAGLYIRDNDSPMKAGDVLGGHTHNFPHATFLSRGEVQCRRWRKIVDANGVPTLDVDGNEQWLEIDNVTRVGPCFFPIEAEDKHEFTALTDDVYLYCIFTPRDPATGTPVPDWNGWMEATL